MHVFKVCIRVTCYLCVIGKTCIAKGRRLGRDWGKMGPGSAIGPAVVGMGVRKAGDCKVFRESNIG